MDYKEEQHYIKKYAETINAKGIFYIPLLGVYSATILIENQHPVTVITEKHNQSEEKTSFCIETGSLSYIVSEAVYTHNKTKVGIYYPYNIEGRHNHEHDFWDICEICYHNHDSFEAEQEEKYYSKQELLVLNMIKEAGVSQYAYSELSLSLSFPYTINGIDIQQSHSFNDLLAIVLQNYSIFKPVETDKYYSINQIEMLEALVAYQRFENVSSNS